MNAERLEMLLNNYAAHLKESGVPERLKTLWRVSECCAAAPGAADAAGLHGLLRDAAPAFAAAGCMQPLNGLLSLAEKEPALLQDALLRLLADDGGDLALRQARMQAFCERCNEKLIQDPQIKRTWTQNIRSAMTLAALFRPAENFLYKSTEARYVADMTGCAADVASGALFSLADFHALAAAVAGGIDAHPALRAYIPEGSALPARALRNLMASDVMMNAGVKKLALFGDAAPLILTRSRAGQAAQERTVQLNVMQLQLEQLEAGLARLEAELEALPEVELVGQRFRSPAFGQVTCVKVQGNLITLETESGQQRMTRPACFLQGHLMPEDGAVSARYEAEEALGRRRQKLRADVINLQCAIRRLQLKP